MKLVAYLRVSGISQANEGFGLDTQRDGIEAWCKANDHEIVATCEDAGVSGTIEGISRPGFRAAVDLIKADKAEGLIAYDLTRIARALIQQEAAIQVLWNADAEIFTVSQGLIEIEDGDGTRTLLRQMAGMISEYQRSSLVYKAKLGKARAKAAGQHTDGLAPFGWRVENKFLVEDQAQQATLWLINQARDEKWSWNSIAQHLNEQLHRHPTGGGGKWYEASVYRVAKRAKEIRNA